MTGEVTAFDPAGVDAVIFDLGGVLLDISFARVFDHWARAASVPVPGSAN